MKPRSPVTGVPPSSGARLHVESATIGYDKRVISDRLTVSIPTVRSR